MLFRGCEGLGDCKGFPQGRSYFQISRIFWKIIQASERFLVEDGHRETRGLPVIDTLKREHKELC